MWRPHVKRPLTRPGSNHQVFDSHVISKLAKSTTPGQTVTRVLPNDDIAAVVTDLVSASEDVSAPAESLSTTCLVGPRRYEYETVFLDINQHHLFSSAVTLSQHQSQSLSKVAL